MNPPSRQIGANRPAIIFFVVVVLCLASLFSGAKAGRIGTAAKRAVAAAVHPFLLAKQSVRKTSDYVTGLFVDYNRLRADNDALHSEVMRLKTAVVQRSELGEENQRLRGLLKFVRLEQRLSLEPVEVMQSAEGILRIDRGQRHGVKPGMAVIAPAGVVGIVVQVDDFASSVATIHHRDCRVGAMVMRNRLRAYDGIIHPSGSDLSRICTMEYIDMKDDVRVGDYVVTSPESLFPAGYPIGKVTGVSGSGTLWKSAEIEPFVDVYKLDEVFVVRQANASPEEQTGPPNEAPVPAPASDAPVAQTLQERYAP